MSKYNYQVYKTVFADCFLEYRLVGENGAVCEYKKMLRRSEFCASWSKLMLMSKISCFRSVAVGSIQFVRSSSFELGLGENSGLI